MSPAVAPAQQREAILREQAIPSALAIGPDVNGSSHPQSVRSYVADGRGVAWSPRLPAGCAAAVDAEIATQRVSLRLARRIGSDDPLVVWPRWTACEVAAKALDLPVLSWLHWPGLQLPEPISAIVSVSWASVDDLLVCFGVAQPPSAHAVATEEQPPGISG